METKLEITLVLDRLRSAFNTGNMVGRRAGALLAWWAC